MECFVITFSSNPEWRPGMSNVTLLCGISGFSFYSHFLSSLPLFCIVFILCLVVVVLTTYSSDFFSGKKSRHLLLRDSRFCLYLRADLLGDDCRWYVQLAAMWHWYLPLCICKCIVYPPFVVVVVVVVILFLFSPILIFRRNGPQYQYAIAVDPFF